MQIVAIGQRVAATLSAYPKTSGRSLSGAPSRTHESPLFSGGEQGERDVCEHRTYERALSGANGRMNLMTNISSGPSPSRRRRARRDEFMERFDRGASLQHVTLDTYWFR